MLMIETRLTYVIGIRFHAGGEALFSGALRFDEAGEINIEYLRRPNDDDATIWRTAWRATTREAAESTKTWLEKGGFPARFYVIEYQEEM